jgi:uncharacterized protein YjiS (DUF1127 family)
MTAHRQALSNYHPIGLFAPFAHAAKGLRDAVRRSLERRRLYLELSSLDPRELSDLRLQPHDIDLLVHGHSVPAIECMSHSR